MEALDNWTRLCNESYFPLCNYVHFCHTALYKIAVSERFLLTITSKAKRILSSKIQYINVKMLESRKKSAKLHLVLGGMLLSWNELWSFSQHYQTLVV